MLKPYLANIFREMVGRKARTVSNLLAVAVPVAIFVVMTSVMNAYAVAIYLPFKDVGADIIVEKLVAQASDNVAGTIQLPFGKGLFNQATVDEVAALPHVKNIDKSLVIWQYDRGKFITVEGIEPGSLTYSRYNSWITAGQPLTAAGRGRALVEKHFAKFYSLKPGDDLLLGKTAFKIAGVVGVADTSQVSANNVYINLADAQSLLDRQGYSQLYVTLDALSSEKTVKSEIAGVDKDAVTLSASSIAAALSNYIGIYETYRLLVLLIVAAVLALVLFHVNTASLAERRRDIGVMQTVGWTRKNISLQIVGEIGIQALLGFVLGLLISLLTVAAVGSVSIQTKISQGLGNDLTTLSAPLQLSGAAALQFFALTLVIAVGLSLFMVRKLGGMKPLDNLKDR